MEKGLASLSASLSILLLAGCIASGSRRDRTLFADREALFGGRGDHVVLPAGTNDVARAGATSVPSRPPLPVLTGKMSLLDAVNVALARNLELRSAFLGRDEAEGAILTARARALPEVGLGAGFERDLSDPGDSPETYSATASVVQPLWRSGAITAGLRYAEFYAESVDEAIRQKAQETIETVFRDYLSVLLGQRMVEVYRGSSEVAERMLDTAEKKRKVGTASDYEVLRAGVEVASSRAALIREQNALETARISLLHHMGIHQDSAIELTGELVYDEERHDPEALLALAMLHRPDLLRADAAVRLAEENLRLEKSAYGPSADFFVSGRVADSDPNDPAAGGWGDDWSAGLRLSFTLYDGLERRGKVIQAESRLRQAQAALRNAEEAARVEIVRALLDVRDAAELYRSQEKNIDLAREALRMIESGNRVGKNTQIEVLDARSALTEAMGLYYKAIHGHLLARLEVRRVAGTLGFDASSVVPADLRLLRDPLAPAVGGKNPVPRNP